MTPPLHCSAGYTIEGLEASSTRRALAASIKRTRRLPALFISDLHLGTRGSQAELALDILSRFEADVYYLVGDIIDGWRLRQGWRWTRATARWCGISCAPATAPGWSSSPATTTNSQRPSSAGASRESRSPSTRCMSPATAGAFSSRTATPSTSSSSVRKPAVVGDRGYRLPLAASTAFNAVTQRLGLPMVALRLGEAQGSRPRSTRSATSSVPCRGGPPARRRWRGLRPHPSPDHARNRRRHLCQHRRFRRILLAGDRARGRRADRAALGPARERVGAGADAVRGQAARSAG